MNLPKATSPSTLRGSRRALIGVLLCGLLAPRAFATWSIVVIDRRTGEVAVGAATCLTGNIRNAVGLVRVGRGVAATQSIPFAMNSGRIWNGITARLTPQQIIDEIVMNDPFVHTRQIGLVTFDGPPVTYTGANVAPGICGIVGEVDDLVYAIQGNVMTGAEVCMEAERALRETPGDLGQRLMAAMEGARTMGGDGRCSCNGQNPTGCGAPPANFTHSAFTGFVLLARHGDVDDDACPPLGCSGGSYYLELEYPGGQQLPDPVIALQRLYDTWREDLAGIPDQVHSIVQQQDQRLVADGVTTQRVTVRLRDIESDPVAAPVSVHVVPRPGDPVATIGAVTRTAPDTYTFELTATQVAGRAVYDILVDNGTHVVQMHPPLGVESLPPADLQTTRWDIRASESATARFVLNLGSAGAGSAYHLYGSAAGTTPGTTLPIGGGLLVPLNRDRLFDLTEVSPEHAGLSAFAGSLDGTGRAEAALSVPAGALQPLVGSTLNFCGVIGSAGTATLTQVVGFPVVP